MKCKFYKLSFLFVLFGITVLQAQEKTLTGNVIDQNGLPLVGVSIVVVGTANGVQTDFDGNYTISTAEGTVLRFSYIGQKTLELKVTSSNMENIQMEEDAEALEEVVVVGYGARSRDEITSAVSTVAAEEIAAFVGTTSIDNILQGKAAGVQVTAANGRPGNTGFVKIRGVGTFDANSTPLYVVDGVPIDPTNVGLVNPNDIENVSILKDAATASKYGSRGSNGVILITTKSGESGEAKITLRQTVGFTQRVQDNFELFDTEGKLAYEEELQGLGVFSPNFSETSSIASEERQFLIDNSVDHEKELLKNGFVQNTNLSISGGSDDLTYFLSIGYGEDTGIVQRADPFKRYTARLNTRYNAKDWLVIGVNASFARSSEQRLREGQNNVQNPILSIYEYNPYQPIFLIDENGNDLLDDQGEPIFSQNFPLAFNSVEAVVNNVDRRTNLQTIASTYADIKFSKNFSNKFQIGISNDRFNRLSLIKPGSRLDQFIATPGAPGQATRAGNNDFEYTLTNVFSYTQEFGKGTVNASALLEYNENTFDTFSLTGEGFPTDQLVALSITSLPSTATTDKFQNSLFSQGLFGDYNFDDRYIVSGSLRRDESSRFGPANQDGLFYSAALAWNLHNESFLTDRNFLNALRFRASYGTSGNQTIPDFLFLELLGFDSTNQRSNLTPNGVGNPDIKWEAQELLDIGVEYAFWNNRVRGVVDYFSKTSNDLLSSFNLSTTVGDENDQVRANIGEVENKGLEFELSVDAIVTQNVRLTIGGNVAFIDNKVKQLVGGLDVFRGFNNNLLLREGEETNTYSLVRYAGVNSQTGAPQYLDVDDNITETFRGSDAVALEGKSPNADIEGGFFTNFRYKSFDLGTNFTFKTGNYIYNAQAQALLQDGNGVNRNQRVEANNFWRNPGDIDVLPSPVFRNAANQASDRFLQKGDFIRLRNLTLGYSLPSKFLERLPIDTFRVTLQGQNLWVYRPHFDGDPEVGSGNTEATTVFQTAGDQASFNYPIVKAYNFGIEIGF